MSNEKVTVRLQLRGRWEYCQDVEMTRAEFENYDAALERGGRDYNRAVRDLSGLYMNPRDVEFEDGDELDDFRILETDA